MKIITSSLMLIFAASCMAVPKTTAIPAVGNFNVEKYLGTWYEIARLPHTFEKNLQYVTATYTLLENGKIQVLNRGYNTKKEIWKDAEGKAWIPDSAKPSELKVSFFWPFSAAYRIIYLEEDYSLAIVTSSKFNYFWILSRTPEISEEYYTRLIAKAKNWGFDTGKIIKVKHK